MDKTTLIGSDTPPRSDRPARPPGAPGGTRASALAAAAVAGAVLAGCAGTAAVEETSIDRVNDPLEPANRVVFAANQAIDTVLLRPVAVTYGTWVPDPIKYNVQSFLRNLRSPLIIANELLQGDWDGAERATTRFFVNTIAGAGGIVDIAGDNLGIPFEPEDFGQTLAVWGVDSGPYLVLPLFGPSTLRDAAGLGVETFADPITNPLEWDLLDDTAMEFVRPGLTAADTRFRTLEVTDELERSSLDYYAAVRSFYLQDRARQITDGAAEDGGDFEIPDYDEGAFDEGAFDPAAETGPGVASRQNEETAVGVPGGSDQAAALPTLVLDIEPVAY